MTTPLAIITGHSRGIGAALAELIEAQGWNVLGLSRSAGTAIDLSSPDALTQWIDSGALAEALQSASEIVLINNAGTVAPIGLVGTADAARITASVNLNVTAPLLLTDAVLRLRPAQTPVRIAHISSGAARRGYPGWAVYCATKAALDLHAQALAAEKQPQVRVASIAPGVIDTDMQQEIRSADGFPLRDTFVALKQDGNLATPADTAAKLWAIITSDDFGSQVVTDVRG